MLVDRKIFSLFGLGHLAICTQNIWTYEWLFSLLKNYSVRLSFLWLNIFMNYTLPVYPANSFKYNIFKIKKNFRFCFSNKSFQMYWSSWIYPKMFCTQMFLHVQIYVFMDTGEGTVTQNVTSNEWCSSDPTSIHHVQMPEERLCLFAWTALKEEC